MKDTALAGTQGCLSGRKNYSIIERIMRSVSMMRRARPPIRFRQWYGKVSLCSFQNRRFFRVRRYAARKARASLTVECALALPLFFFALTTMISFMDLYRIETVHLTDLCSKAKQAASYTYNPASSGGVKDIILPDLYSFQPVSGLFPVRRITRYNLVRAHRWNGKLHTTVPSGTSTEKMVYVTASGTVFHRRLDCRYLNVSITSISSAQLKTRKNQYGQSYEPCEMCARGATAGIVYITSKGNRFHNRPDCSGMKRTIRMIRESQAAGFRPCSRCG